jgi:hypothetical protein
MQIPYDDSTADLEAITSATDLNRMPPTELAHKVGLLIRQFHLSGSRDLALQVADHLDSLCFHPRLGADRHLRCNYLRLRAQWRWLARTLPEGAHV